MLFVSYTLYLVAALLYFSCWIGMLLNVIGIFHALFKLRQKFCLATWILYLQVATHLRNNKPSYTPRLYYNTCTSILLFAVNINTTQLKFLLKFIKLSKSLSYILRQQNPEHANIMIEYRSNQEVSWEDMLLDLIGHIQKQQAFVCDYYGIWVACFTVQQGKRHQINLQFNR